ncbi:winged helix-turn-helix transcriptional regulator [Jidongwangia harbinensis]|uniref:winged helix-turn-helix transcriptional regulator n=1 Tax=Jidongwangia harbinensis TaxID=2878561 RepID=UPI001CDA20D2|nr:helix-turn-helix domain-containing protein [Jidongwangia harbinensis]MCA2216973.1 helix-turn-helix transcriptional regulator [Jidongwangia harbinensis]
MVSSAPPPPLFAEHGADAGGVCETLSEPLSRVMTLLGKRWTGVVWGTLMQGPVYFSDLRRGIPGINDRILNERLVELVDLGLATRTVIDERPIRVRYQLTEHGAAIRPALDELTRWAQEHLQQAVDR